LVDTLVSGTSDRKVVQVRVLFWAPQIDQKLLKALKSNDLGAFIFGENIKKIIMMRRIVTKNNYIPRMIEDSILSILLIFRAIFSEGSLLPLRYSLTREGETPIFFANVRCDIDSWSNLIFITSASEGLPIGKWDSSYSITISDIIFS